MVFCLALLPFSVSISLGFLYPLPELFHADFVVSDLVCLLATVFLLGLAFRKKLHAKGVFAYLLGVLLDVHVELDLLPLPLSRLAHVVIAFGQRHLF